MSTPPSTPKEMQKLWEWRNRVKKLVPGTARIWKLGEVADELRITLYADVLHPDAIEKIEGLVVYLERLEYDLIVLNDFAHGKSVRTGISRSDPRHWRGPRP